MRFSNSAALKGLSAACGLLLLAAAGCGRGASPMETRDVTLHTPDGKTLAGTLFVPEAKEPPGLVLVHGAGRDRSVWSGFAERACRDGFLCLAFDLRGHGCSAGGPHGHREYTQADWLKILADLGVACRTLVAAGADARNLALAGEGLGANLVLLHARGNTAVQAVALLSPGLEYSGIRAAPALARLREVPVLILAAENDAYGARSASALEQTVPGFCQMHLYDGAAHGADLLAASDHAGRQILDWLADILCGKAHKAREETHGG